MNRKSVKLVWVLLTCTFSLSTLWAQTPEKMSYQAVIRNSSDILVTNTQIGMEINIHQGSVSGTVVYTETQTPTTNANGLVSIEIGGGAGFNTIDWSAGPYFIETKTDPTGGTNYTITGTSQLLSVPYALHAKTAETITGGITETDPSVPIGTQIGQMQYWNGTAWVSVAAGTTGQKLSNVNGIPTWIDSDALIDPVSGQIWKDVTNPTTGEVWMDRNLGASQVATSSTDSAAYGDLYQWGRAADGHQVRTSGKTSTLSNSDTPGHGDFITSNSPYDWRSPQNDNLWQGVTGTNNPCPSGYRIPTAAEWETERTSWENNNAAGAFASPLKLPLAGNRSGMNGSPHNVGSGGYYWSSTVDGTNSNILFFSSNNAFIGNNGRAFGFSVRCLKD